MLEIRMRPPTVGAGIGPTGNPEIYAIDEKNGQVMIIEIESQKWKDVLAGFAKVRGVGIYPANALPVEKGKPA